MRFEFFVASRYLVARRKQAVISLVTLISILGVTAGVMALIVALALNAGFEEEFRNRILGATSHVSLMRLGNVPIGDYEALSDRLAQVEGVVSVSPTVYGQAQLTSDLNRQRPIVLRGVDSRRRGILDELLANIVEGSSQDFQLIEPAPSILLGQEAAEALGILVGDHVRAIGLQGELSPLGRLPRSKNFKVIAIFESGLWDYDANWAVVPMEAAQRFVGLDRGQVSALEFRVADIDKARQTAERILAEVGEGFTARTWIEINRPLFSALKLEKLALFIAISLIVLVASLNIISTLTLMVMDKNRDIAILAAMGATPRTVTQIFRLQGLIIGVVGTALGSSLGLLAVWYLDTFQIFQLEPQVYSIPHVPFRSHWSDVLLVSVTALLVSFFATLYPARSAASLDPIKALRHE